MKPKIAVITGPTATGKTALSIMLAKEIGGEIVSADSMQIYKHMNIGTAKPDAREMAGIRHHMLDIVSPFENYSVARFVQDAAACVDEIISRGKLPIVVGGTGLYIDALIAGREFSAEGDENTRRELAARYDSLGGEYMLNELRNVDAESAERLHFNDKKRIVRALEIYLTSGMTITEHNEMTKKIPPRYDACKIVLNYTDRADLYHRIDRRVDGMMRRGLLNEVRTLLDMGLTREHTAMQAIGYKEMAGVILNNENLNNAVEHVKQESRRYAKRQVSWLRRDECARWIMWEKEPNFDNGLQISTNYLEENGYNRAV